MLSEDPQRSTPAKFDTIDERAPRDGDVVVTRDGIASAPFMVRLAPGEPQFAVKTGEEAICVARAYAKVHKLDFWFGDGQRWRLVESYRARTGS